MESRTLENLILENEDYIFAGDLTITGEVNIINGSLIVSGVLTLQKTTTIKGGNIDCFELDSNDIVISDGDIYVHEDAYLSNVKSDGNIEIGKDCIANYISCFNYLVNGDNDSISIIAVQDVYILGDNDSYNIEARDVLIGGTCTLNGESLIAKCFECGGSIEDCSSMSIG